MELVIGLHTTTNSQTEQGMKGKKARLVTQTSIETGDKDSFVQSSQWGSSVVSVYCMEPVFIIDKDF